MIVFRVDDKNYKKSYTIIAKSIVKWLPNSSLISEGEMLPKGTKYLIQIIQPDKLKYKRGIVNISYFSFEGTKIPQNWVDKLNVMDKVWVPSKHTKELYRNSGVRDRIDIIPYGFEHTAFRPGKKIGEIFENNYVFMFHGGWRHDDNDRKGLSTLIRAYHEEFKPGEEVLLYVKLNVGSVPDYSFERGLRNMGIKKVNNKIVVNQKLYPMPTELSPLYHKADCFISPSRAEGFNIPVLEACASGLPVIITGWSGHTEISPYAIKLRYRVRDACKAYPHIYEGSKWVEPSLTDLKRKMRWCYENRDKAKTLGQKNLEWTRKMTWQNVARSIARRCK